MVLKAAEERIHREEELKNQNQFALEEANLRIKLLSDELWQAGLETKQREEIFSKIALISKRKDYIPGKKI
jgi:hypothetical protein